MREPVSRLVRACLSVCCCAGVVLEIEFPSGIQTMFDFLSLLAINLKSILQVQCLTDYHLGELADIAAAAQCMPCSGLPCIDCTDGVRVSAGWSLGPGASQTPWFVFHCPEESACLNEEGQKCRDGHEGHLCNVCKDDYSMLKGLCDPCSFVNSSVWTPVLMLTAVCLLVALVYVCRRRASRADGPASSLELQLTDNPLQSDSSSPGSKRSSLSLRAVDRSDDAYMLVRVLYQPARILIGYGQVVNQIGA